MEEGQSVNARLIAELDTYRPQIRRHIQSRISDPDLVEDCLNETFEQALRSLQHRSTPIQSPLAWLFKIADRVCQRLRGEEMRHRHLRQPTYYQTEDGELRCELDDLADDEEQQPEHVIIRKERVSRLQQGVQELSPESQQLLTWYLEGKSPQEMARRTGRPRRTVHNRLQRTLRHLARYIG